MNRARGEVTCEIAGVPHVLCVTLGALAELETLFACANLAELQARLARLSALEMQQVLQVLARAGGQDVDVERVRPSDAARAIAEAFHAALA